MTTLNHTRLPRKSLSTQLDRLDVILDGLADALNGSVEAAVRDVIGHAVREAVAATVREVLSQPDLLRASLDQHAPSQAQPATPRRTLRDLLSGAGRRCAGLVTVASATAGRAMAVGLAWWSRRLRSMRDRAVTYARAVAQQVGLARALLAAACHTIWAHRRVAGAAAAAGLVTGAVVYLAGPLVASVTSGLWCSACTAAWNARPGLRRAASADPT